LLNGALARWGQRCRKCWRNTLGHANSGVKRHDDYFGADKQGESNPALWRFNQIFDTEEDGPAGGQAADAGAEEDLAAIALGRAAHDDARR
jgi:hypothetical protein